MGAEEEMVITLSGGAPWGFRLQGGSEQKKPLQVSKIRKRSKACRGGLWENDVLVSINGKSCAGLSHATVSICTMWKTPETPAQPLALPLLTAGFSSSSPHLTHCFSFSCRIVGGDQTGPRLQRSPSPGQRVLSPPSPLSPPGTAAELRAGRSPGHHAAPAAPEGTAAPGQPHLPARQRGEAPPGPQEEPTLPARQHQQQGGRAPGRGVPVRAERLREHAGGRHAGGSRGGQLRRGGQEGDPCLSLSLAELHRHESIQEKNVKEAKTKCRTIASLLTDAPNPHSKGVLMFKKRRQRAKKYTLVSFGSVDEDRSYEEEDGVFPTSESEFDEEGFSDARSLTNNSDWDNTYLDIEKSKSDSEQKDEKQKGLSEASGKGARLFEQQRERAGKYTVEKVPAEKGPQLAPAVQPQPGMLNGEMPVPQKTSSVPLSIHLEGVPVPSKQPATLPAPLLAPSSPTVFQPAPGTPDPFSASTASMFNRSARPFTPGFSGQRPATSSVIFSPAPPQHVVSSSPLPAQPSPATSPATPRPPSEPLTSREQRISVPAPRTGILQEARRRGNKKPMFSKIEEKKKNSPNPELLSLVQNLDEKPKGDHPGAGFESGPEEDFLSLGAEACNFMQSSGRKFKTPPPVAPKPQQQDAGLVNGSSLPNARAAWTNLWWRQRRSRSPSPGPPLLPLLYLHPGNIHPTSGPPPPIAYNPMHSPFYPLAASKSQASKAESKVKKAPGQKSGLKVIDFMRHQPYQLKSAMFCFGDPPSPSTQEPPAQAAPQPGSSFPAAKQVPVKTAKAQEIRRFSTPAPAPASGSMAPTVLVPRSATTLDEPVWRTEMASSAPATPAPFQVELSQSPKPYQSSPELVQASLGPSPNPASASRFQVARPKFSAARTGMQANVWRPSFGHH
uniref:Synaptopodin 2-like protein n=1 Tax=Anas platyrhynchos platyrhynchos TaxID=8840 RepID=A0A493TW87_ANAPP